MTILVAILIFVGVYAVSKFLLSKVQGIGELVETLSIVLGVVVALLYAKVL